MNAEIIAVGAIVYCVAGFLIGFVCIVVLFPKELELTPLMKVLWLLWPLAVPITVLTLLFTWRSPELPWTKESRLQRRIAAARREANLLDLRRAAEVEERRTREALNRYLESEP